MKDEKYKERIERGVAETKANTLAMFCLNVERTEPDTNKKTVDEMFSKKYELLAAAAICMLSNEGGIITKCQLLTPAGELCNTYERE